MGRNQSKLLLSLEWDGKCDCQFECECEGVCVCECECECECEFKCEGECECECKGKCECECECECNSESESNSKSDRAARRPREVLLIAARTPKEARSRGLGLVPGSASVDHELGHKLAVNRTYICNSFNLGHIQIINAQTSLRSLFRGHTQRVSDMAFFAEDVHLLASASVSGQVIIWRISEGPHNKNKPQITVKLMLVIQISAEGKSVYPHICWHSHKKEILFVSFGNCILRINAKKAGSGKRSSVDNPVRVTVNTLNKRIHCVGKHDGEVTDLSMYYWLTTRLASASTDGTVKIWEDCNAVPLVVLRPHEDRPVSSVNFLTSLDHPDNIILVTSGPLNCEVKMWNMASEEGWLLPGKAQSCQCSQILDLRSSTQQSVEEAVFDQVVAMPQSGVLLLAHAKKNSIYAVHIDYGPNPATTRMDYIVELAVTTPIYSLKGISGTLSNGEDFVHVCCIHAHGVERYGLSLHLRTPLESLALDRTDNNAPRSFHVLYYTISAPTIKPHGRTPLLSTSSDSSFLANNPQKLSPSKATSLPDLVTSAVESELGAILHSNGADTSDAASPVHLGPRMYAKSTDLGLSSPLTAVGEQAVLDRRVDAFKEPTSDLPCSCGTIGKDREIVAQHDNYMVPSSPVMFEHPADLITPLELLSLNASSAENFNNTAGTSLQEEKVKDIFVSVDMESIEVEIKVVDEIQGGQVTKCCPGEGHIAVTEKMEQLFCSQVSGCCTQIATDYHVEYHSINGAQKAHNVSLTAALGRPNAVHKEVQNSAGDKDGEATVSIKGLQSVAKDGDSQKEENSKVFFSSSNPSNFIYSSSESCSSSAQSMQSAVSQLLTMRDILDQLLKVQQEMQMEMSVMLSQLVSREGRRLEEFLGQNIEKSVNASMDALWACFLDENAKREKSQGELTQQSKTLFNNCFNKKFPSLLEKTVKKETAELGPVIALSIKPILEKIVTLAIEESFEVKMSKHINISLDRQIQAPLGTFGNQALQDIFRSVFQDSFIPGVEASWKALFTQVNAKFQGLLKDGAIAHQKFEAAYSPLAVALKEVISSGLSITQTLSGELADGQRKLLAIVAAGANLNTFNPLATQMSYGPLEGLMAELTLDRTIELSRLVSNCKYEEAFTAALQRNDVSIVSWLCSLVDLQKLLASKPLPLSQPVMLSLFQQLACDTSVEATTKLDWMTEISVNINPAEPSIALHVRPILGQVYQILRHQRNQPTVSALEASSISILTRVIHSVLMSCK